MFGFAALQILGYGAVGMGTGALSEVARVGGFVLCVVLHWFAAACKGVCVGRGLPCYGMFCCGTLVSCYVVFRRILRMTHHVCLCLLSCAAWLR